MYKEWNWLSTIVLKHIRESNALLTEFRTGHIHGLYMMKFIAQKQFLKCLLHTYY